jgi:hypothetical protein
MQVDRTDDEASALRKLLAYTVEYDRYPLSPRIQTLRRILAKFEPRAPSPPPARPPTLEERDPRRRPALDRGGLGDRPRLEQPSNQLGAPAEAPLLSRSYILAGEFGLDLLKHPRQRHREGDEGSVQIGGGHSGFLCSGLSGHCQRRLASGVDNAA